METASITETEPTPLRWAGLLIASSISLALAVYLFDAGTKRGQLFLVGLAMGVALYHAAFGFTGAYRKAIVNKDLTGVSAQFLMIVLAMVLFAPFLASGEAFGRPVGGGALAPVGVSMAIGAFIFGIGMQLAGGCGSGTLFTFSGGNMRMGVVLVFFCAGAFWGSLDLSWWGRFYEMPSAVSLGRELGWWIAIPLQIAALGGIYLALRWLGLRNRGSLFGDGPMTLSRLLRGPWPLIVSAVLLAVLNWLTLIIAGHPWSITWGFTLWAAKAAVAVGWDPASSDFWSGRSVLARPVLADVTSVMNFGIMLGALAAASLSARRLTPSPGSATSWAAAIVGGLLLGYGARLAYGCNIGAFFSGIASTSLHGWVWIVCAVGGNMIGVRVRSAIRLA